MAEKTRIPAELDTEDPFLSVAELKLSLRQGLTILMTLFLWFMIMQLTVFLLPVSTIFAGVIWSWIVISGLFLALVKKDGRPYEEHLSNRIVYLLSSKTFVQRDPKVSNSSVEEAIWREIDEEEDLAPPHL